ncbi:MAG: DUF2974 domain-containing protein [Clostridia bacterium]|nr:DUF2974 domain-containing protein [Clostridia bacterium]
MTGIVEYSLLNAHKDFNTMPFTKVDGLIFAQLAYLDYDEFVPDKQLFARGITFSNICEQEDFDELFPLERTARKNLLLFNSMAYSKRYGKIRIRYHENIFDSEKEIQFSATTFIMPNGDACVSFRGTDSTITGWRENFNMLYNDTVPAQLSAVKYLNNVARKIRGKITVVGHSKGGNLAIYASVMCSPKAKEKIVEVQSFDSPGFTEEFVTSQQYLETESKILKFVPEESMIGMLLNDTASYRIVKSDGEGIHQHDPFLWIVEDNDFVTGEKIHTKAKFVNSTFKEWVGNFTPQQRELFVDAMFDIVEATNVQKAESFVDWSENLKGNTSIILDTIKDLDPETRSFMLKVLRNIFPSATDSVLTKPKKIFKDTFDKIKSRKVETDDSLE